jgi:prephenate dehydrogenase
VCKSPMRVVASIPCQECPRVRLALAAACFDGAGGHGRGEPDRAGRLLVAGPGLIDSTRLALSAYELWRDILATNTESIEQALTAYINELEQLRENLRTHGAREEFARGAELAERLRSGSRQ